MQIKEAKIRVGKSKFHRRGLIAVWHIKKGEKIFKIEGVRIKFLINNEAQAAKAGWNWVGWDKNTWIDPVSYGLYINHSCNPNAGIKNRRDVVAIKNIKKGEEVTFDYSLSEADIFWHIQCNCRATNCRKTIRSIQFLPEKIFKKEKKYIPPYFQKVFRGFRIARFLNRVELRKRWVNFIEKGFRV